MKHQVKLDASFLSLVIAVAVVEVLLFSILTYLPWTNQGTYGIEHSSLQGLGRSLDSELDLVVRAMPYVMSPGYKTKL